MVLNHFLVDHRFRNWYSRWEQQTTDLFIRLAQVVHRQKLDWYFVAGGNGLLRFGRKEPNHDAVRVQGYLSAAGQVDWNTLSGSTGRWHALSNDIVDHFQNGTLTPTTVRMTSVLRPGYWPDDYILDESEAISEHARELDEQELQARLAGAPQLPTTTQRTIEVFVRNPYVVEFVQRRANGICENCGKPAPFRRPNGTPFLEVHHRVRLIDGGHDTADNAVGVCPNCHRQIHYG
jgi:hypothetical protein